MGTTKGSGKRKSVAESTKKKALKNLNFVAEAAYLAANADGDLASNEYDAIVQVIVQLFDGDVSEEDVHNAVDKAYYALEASDIDSRLNHLGGVSADEDSCLMALIAAATVLQTDSPTDEEAVGAELGFYERLAAQLAFSQEVAVDIWNDVYRVVHGDHE